MKQSKIKKHSLKIQNKGMKLSEENIEEFFFDDLI